VKGDQRSLAQLAQGRPERGGCAQRANPRRPGAFGNDVKRNARPIPSLISEGAPAGIAATRVSSADVVFRFSASHSTVQQNTIFNSSAQNATTSTSLSSRHRKVFAIEGRYGNGNGFLDLGDSDPSHSRSGEKSRCSLRTPHQPFRSSTRVLDDCHKRTATGGTAAFDGRSWNIERSSTQSPRGRTLSRHTAAQHEHSVRQSLRSSPS